MREVHGLTSVYSLKFLRCLNLTRHLALEKESMHLPLVAVTKCHPKGWSWEFRQHVALFGSPQNTLARVGWTEWLHRSGRCYGAEGSRVPSVRTRNQAAVSGLVEWPSRAWFSWVVCMFPSMTLLVPHRQRPPMKQRANWAVPLWSLLLTSEGAQLPGTE